MTKVKKKVMENAQIQALETIGFFRLKSLTFIRDMGL